MVNKNKATSSEIMEHLSALLGISARDIALQSSQLFEASRKEEGLTLLSTFDASLGGTGIYRIQSHRKLPGVYRGLTYVWMPLQIDHPEQFSRDMIHSACGYLEELLKKIAKIWPWEGIKADSLPLGTLTHKARKHLPAGLYDELTWLSSGVYNFAKHHYNTEDDDEPNPEHYFSLSEALAVYLIVRKLGLELESMIPASKRVGW